MLEAGSGGARRLTVRVATGADATARVLGRGLAQSDWTLLPIDVSARSEATDDLAIATKLRTTAGGLSWLELPGRSGSLYRFHRVGPDGSFEGLLHIDARGWPRVPFEVRASAAGALEPCLGVSELGERVLCATQPAAGGNLVDVRISEHRSIVRTALAPPISVRPGALFVARGFAFAVATDGVWRYSTLQPEQASKVETAFSPPTHWSGAAALSPRRTSAVFLAGTGPGALRPYVFSGESAAFSASSELTQASSAGYATDSPFGPFLYVSDLGRTVAWRVENVTGAAGQLSSEVHVGRTAAGTPAIEASGDPYVIDTLTEIGGVIGSVAVDDAFFLVGEPNDPTEGGVESAELLAATPSANGGITLRNVTNTMGDAVPPFTNGVPSLTPARIDVVSPERALIWDDEDKRILSVDLAGTGFDVVRSGVREVFALESVGREGAWVASVEFDTDNRERALIGAASAELPAAILDLGNEFTTYDAWTSDRPSGRVLVRRRDPGGDRLLLVRPRDATVAAVPISRPTIDARATFVGADGIAFAESMGGGLFQARAWDESSGIVRELGLPRALHLLR